MWEVVRVITYALMLLATILNGIGFVVNIRSWRKWREESEVLLRENIELRDENIELCVELRKYREKEKKN